MAKPLRKSRESNPKEKKYNKQKNQGKNDWGKVFQYLIFSILFAIAHAIIGSNIIFYITRIAKPVNESNNNGLGDYLDNHFPDDVEKWPYFLTEKQDPEPPWEWKKKQSLLESWLKYFGLNNFDQFTKAAIIGENLVEDTEEVVNILTKNRPPKGQKGGKGNIGLYTCDPIPIKVNKKLNMNQRYFPYNLAGSKSINDTRGDYNNKGTLYPQVIFGLAMAEVSAKIRFFIKHILNCIKPEQQNFNPKFIMTGVGGLIFAFFLLTLGIGTLIIVPLSILIVSIMYENKMKQPPYNPKTASIFDKIINFIVSMFWWWIQIFISPLPALLISSIVSSITFIKFMYDIFIKPLTTDNGRETFKSVCKCNIVSIMFTFCILFLSLTCNKDILDTKIWGGMAGTAGCLLLYNAYKRMD